MAPLHACVLLSLLALPSTALHAGLQRPSPEPLAEGPQSLASRKAKSVAHSPQQLEHPEKAAVVAHVHRRQNSSLQLEQPEKATAVAHVPMKLNSSLAPKQAKWVSRSHRRQSTTPEGQARCRAACGCDRAFAFVAETETARGLYTGCNAAAGPVFQQPDLVVIGAQKGGTTSLYQGANGRWCAPKGPWSAEAHFFDQPEWLEQKPSAKDFHTEYLSMWEHCDNGQSIWMEKTPSYLWAPAAPIRTCEMLRGVKLAVLLRDPVARAYSSFFNKNSHFDVPRTPAGFHHMATLEVAIAQKCGGVPLGDPQQDSNTSAYRTCCREVAAANGATKRWQGCECHAGPSIAHTCTPYGHKDYSVVRMGLYAPLLRNWYRYHRAEDMLVFYSEEFFQDMPLGLCQLQCHVSAESAMASCSSHPSGDFSEKKLNSWAHGHGDMLPETRAMLQRFYRPHNEELFQLLGRRADWR